MVLLNGRLVSLTTALEYARLRFGLRLDEPVLSSERL